MSFQESKRAGNMKVLKVHVLDPDNGRPTDVRINVVRMGPVFCGTTGLEPTLPASASPRTAHCSSRERPRPAPLS